MRVARGACPEMKHWDNMNMNKRPVSLRGGLTAMTLAFALSFAPGALFAEESSETAPRAETDTAAEAAPAAADSADSADSVEGTEPVGDTASDEEAGPAGEAESVEDGAPGEADEPAGDTGTDQATDAAPVDEADSESSAAVETPAADELADSDASTGDSDDPDPVEGPDSGNGNELTEIETRDPLEGMNRVFFKFNDTLDRLFLKPIAKIYRTIIPTFVQDRVRNVINNSNAPVILANDILQWKWGRAGDTTARFFINTTIGLGGIFEVAEGWGIKRHDEDFGQTLGVWGVGEWLYLYLPFVGPTSPRDLVGKVADRYFDPLTYYADVIRNIDFSDSRPIKFNIDTAGIAQLARGGAGLLDLRARNIDTLNEIERTSIDFYAGVRSLYRQSRDSAINDGKVDFEDLPDLSDEFE